MRTSQSISQRKTRVSCRGYGSIPQAHGDNAVNQGGTADTSFVLGKRVLLSWAFFILKIPMMIS